MNANDRAEILKTLKGNRGPRDSNCQTVLNYFYIEADSITNRRMDGDELDFGVLFDTTSLIVADVLPAGINNYLTPYASRWASFRHRNKEINQRDAVRRFMKDVEDEVFYTLNKSNFYDQVTQFYKGSGTLGTSCMYVEDDLDDVVRFYDIPFRQFYIVDDSKARASEFYLLFEYTSFQMIDRFGINQVPDDVRKLYEQNDRDCFKKREVLLYIGPRHERNPLATNVGNMPIQAQWIDMETKAELEDSGYRRLPCFAHRFYRRSGDPYGYSPAMKAIADVRWANTMGRTEMQGTQLRALPPLALPNNAFIKPFNMNPLKQNFYNRSVISGKDDIFPVGGWADVNVNDMMLEKKIDAIKEHMFYNVFLAFRGITKQMTVPEVMQKAREEMSILGPAVGRFESDFLDEVIHLVVEKLFLAGRLPELPDELQGDPSYEIEYTSLLARSQKATDFQSLQQSLMTAGQVAPLIPSILDNVDGDRLMDSIWEMNNTDPTILKDDDKVQAEREQKAKQQQVNQQLMQDQVQAQTLETASKADVNRQAVANG